MTIRGDKIFDSKVQFHHGFFQCVFDIFDCPENYLNSFFFMHQIHLPKLLFSPSPLNCFLGISQQKQVFSHTWPGRTELGKAGQEHRGIFRVHQFLQIDVWSGWNQPSAVVGFGKFQMACRWSLTLPNLGYGLFIWWMKLNHAASQVVQMFISRRYPF